MIDIQLRKEIQKFVAEKELPIISSVRTSYMDYIQQLNSVEPQSFIIPFPIKERYNIIVDGGLHVSIWEGEIKIDKIFLKGTYGIQDPITFKTEIYATFSTAKRKNASTPNYLSMRPAYGVHFMFDGEKPTNFPQICLGDYNLDSKDTTSLEKLMDIGGEVSRLLSGVNLSSLGQKYFSGEEVNAKGDIELLETCEGSVLWVEHMITEGRIKKLL